MKNNLQISEFSKELENASDFKSVAEILNRYQELDKDSIPVYIHILDKIEKLRGEFVLDIDHPFRDSYKDIRVYSSSGSEILYFDMNTNKFKVITL